MPIEKAEDNKLKYYVKSYFLTIISGLIILIILKLIKIWIFIFYFNLIYIIKFYIIDITLSIKI